MFWELGLGGLVIAASVILQVAFIGVIVFGFETFSHLLARPPRMLKLPIGLAAATLWMMAAHSLAVWLWAAVFIAVGAFDSMEPALYFAAVCYTTLGFGDIVPEQDWRILSGLCAANGLLIFGLSTAFLVELLRRMWSVMTRGVARRW